MNIRAKYTAFFDDGAEITTECDYNLQTMEVTNIEPADNVCLANDAVLITYEYVELRDGTVLDEEDGVEFVY